MEWAKEQALECEGRRGEGECITWESLICRHQLYFIIYGVIYAPVPIPVRLSLCFGFITMLDLCCILGTVLGIIEGLLEEYAGEGLEHQSTEDNKGEKCCLVVSREDKGG